MTFRLFATSVAILSAASTSALAQAPKGTPLTDLVGRATVEDAKGQKIGTINLQETTDGVVVRIAVNGLPAGEHAIHIHAFGTCEPPFTSAGPHFNPANKKHGTMSPEGPHAGDFPNITVSASGEVKTEFTTKFVTLKQFQPSSVFKERGTAFVIHAGPDDHKTDPAGNSGDRIACGVIAPGE